MTSDRFKIGIENTIYFYHSCW